MLLGCCHRVLGFPGGSDGKESACNVGDPRSVLGSGRFPGEGNGYPLQYSCWRISWTASLAVAMGLQRVWQDWTTNTFTFSLITPEEGLVTSLVLNAAWLLGFKPTANYITQIQWLSLGPQLSHDTRGSPGISQSHEGWGQDWSQCSAIPYYYGTPTPDYLKGGVGAFLAI